MSLKVLRRKWTPIYDPPAIKPAARGDGKDVVFSFTGTGFKCFFPIITRTNKCSDNVFVNSIGHVRLTDLVGEHPFGGCGPDLSPLTLGARTVFVNSLNAGRLTDIYTPDNLIITGSENVFIGKKTGPMGPPGEPGLGDSLKGIDVLTREFGTIKVPLTAESDFILSREGPVTIDLIPKFDQEPIGGEAIEYSATDFDDNDSVYTLEWSTEDSGKLTTKKYDSTGNLLWTSDHGA
jgi:hypothetical protein